MVRRTRVAAGSRCAHCLAPRGCGSGFDNDKTTAADQRPGQPADPDRARPATPRPRRSRTPPPRGRSSRQHGHRHPGAGHQPAARPGVRRRHAAGRLLRRRRPVRRLRRARRARAVRRQGRRTRTTSTEPAQRVHLRRQAGTARPRTSPRSRLAINTDLWKKAGLTDADYPTTWDQLTAVAQKLKAKARSRRSRLGDTRDRHRRVHGAGRRLADQQGRHAGRPPTPRRTSRPCSTCKTLLKNGLAKYPKQLDAGWGGEAFGKGKAAMTIEGNWIEGAMKSDFPDVKYTVVALPAGPAGKGTLSFTNCWGVAAKSKYKDAGVDFVEAMTARTSSCLRQGVRRHAVAQSARWTSYAAAVPGRRGVRGRRRLRPGPGERAEVRQVLADFDADLQGAGRAATRSTILTDLQTERRRRHRQLTVGTGPPATRSAAPPGARAAERHRRTGRNDRGAGRAPPAPAAARQGGIASGRPGRLAVRRPGRWSSSGCSCCCRS